MSQALRKKDRRARFWKRAGTSEVERQRACTEKDVRDLSFLCWKQPHFCLLCVIFSQPKVSENGHPE